MAKNAITFVKRPALFAFDEKSGKQVFEGDTVIDFRGETATVAKLSRAKVPGKSGKVVVTQGDSSPQREYYDGVFGLVVTDVPPGKYDVYTLDPQGNGVLVKRNVKAHNVIDVMSSAMIERGHWDGGDYHPSK
jgi:hypothetical protein